jgi:hypothetical protein
MFIEWLNLGKCAVLIGAPVEKFWREIGGDYYFFPEAIFFFVVFSSWLAPRRMKFIFVWVEQGR